MCQGSVSQCFSRLKIKRRVFTKTILTVYCFNRETNLVTDLLLIEVILLTFKKSTSGLMQTFSLLLKKKDKIICIVIGTYY